jgi:hypothetical protein
MAENKKCEFVILSTFLSPKFAEILINNNPSINFTFVTLFYSDYLLKHRKYIENGGLIGNVKDDDGYLRNEFTVFTKENFSQNFRMNRRNSFSTSK